MCRYTERGKNKFASKSILFKTLMRIMHVSYFNVIFYYCILLLTFTIFSRCITWLFIVIHLKFKKIFYASARSRVFALSAVDFIYLYTKSGYFRLLSCKL